MYLLVNFGGPRSLSEIPIFLRELLCDRDVIRSRMPAFLHNWIFRRVAKKRATTIAADYQEIGGFSPIYQDTEMLAEKLSSKLSEEVIPFHRYLPGTHAETFRRIKNHPFLKVIPLFPQFCYATTGSIARFFSHLPSQQLRWIKSYAAHPAFIRAYQKKIAIFLQENSLKEEETLLLFSAHGAPIAFIETGDVYETECHLSFQAVMKAFPKAQGNLCYQSKFGRGEWLKPYTSEICKTLRPGERKNVVFVPISFTSDHIETLFEVEKLYLPIVQNRGFHAYRCPALNLEPYWIDSLAEIAQETNLLSTQMLIYS